MRETFDLRVKVLVKILIYAHLSSVLTQDIDDKRMKSALTAFVQRINGVQEANEKRVRTCLSVYQR